MRQVGNYPIVTSVFDCKENKPLLDIIEEEKDVTVIKSQQEKRVFSRHYS